MKKRLPGILWPFAAFVSSFLLFTHACVSYHPVVKQESSFYKFHDSIASGEDSSIQTLLAPFKSGKDKEMNQVIAVSSKSMQKDQPEGALGNFCADAVLKKAQSFCKDSCPVDFSLLNNGGLRSPLPKGDITIGNVFELMPFENELVIFTLKGEDVKDLLDHIANKGGMPVGGLRMKIKNNMPFEVVIGNAPFDISKTYSIATSDYLAFGGDNMHFFAKAVRKTFSGKRIRDIILEVLKEENQAGKMINAKKDGRIEVIE